MRQVRRDEMIFEVLSRRCVWSIVKVLHESNCKIMNITALVNRLNSNHGYVSKCLELMEKLGMVDVAKIGRLKLVRLNTDNVLVKQMIKLIESSNSDDVHSQASQVIS